MFGDLFGNVQQQQEEMKKKLATISVVGESGDGAVKVTKLDLKPGASPRGTGGPRDWRKPGGPRL